jgi:hypothetical protein
MIRKKYLSNLDAMNFPKNELIAFNVAFSGDNDVNLAEAQIADINAHLTQLSDDQHILMLSIE